MISERAWADIDLAALRQNLAVLRELAAPDRDVMLVVKADAYGHGMQLVATIAQRCGIRSFGVRDSSEALELRSVGISGQILVLGTAIESELQHCLEMGIELAIHSTDRVKSLRQLVRRMNGRLRSKPRVHLNVDTGMGRLGLPADRAPQVLDAILHAPELQLVGIMTHLARPEGGFHPFTLEQSERFQRVLKVAESRSLKLGSDGVRVHIGNSAALFTGMSLKGDLVRPGIAAYGFMPKRILGGMIPGSERLAPVMSLRGQIAFMKDVPKGTSISYAQEWTAPNKTRIATVPIGYYDGIPWRLKGKGFALVRGQRAPIVGRVTMDYVMLDIGSIPGAKVGDVVTLFGRDGDAEIPVSEIAEAVDTIPYEITCMVGTRVKRVPIDRDVERDHQILPRIAVGDSPLVLGSESESGLLSSADEREGDGNALAQATGAASASQ
ncbi:MAG: alanine racemase [Planctomycetes bacterium]|nr:alanine racemase [Planctomycetota bacterium]